MEAVDKILAHYGVRGMKWGVRNKRKNQAQVASPKSPEAAQVHAILGNIHKNGIGAASNSDLKILQERMKLETKYKEIFPKQKTVVDHGLEIAKRILLPVAEQQARNFLTGKANALIGPAAPVKQNPKPDGATPKAVDSVLKVGGHHKIHDQPRTPLPHFGFA